METEAPNFNGNYPLGGEQIGPAWRTLWSQLSDTEWICGNDLVYPLAGGMGLNPETLKNLLRNARSHGLLEVKQDMRPDMRRRSSFYRVVS